MKRATFALIWCVIFYFFGCFLVGGIAGGIAGARDPDHASIVGAEAGRRTVEGHQIHILAGAVALSAFGSILGVLPGTRKKPVASVGRAIRVWIDGSKVRVELEDGREIAFPVDRFPWMRGATDEQLRMIRIEPGGQLLRWYMLDQNVLLSSFLAG